MLCRLADALLYANIISVLLLEFNLDILGHAPRYSGITTRSWKDLVLSAPSESRSSYQDEETLSEETDACCSPVKILVTLLTSSPTQFLILFARLVPLEKVVLLKRETYSRGCHTRVWDKTATAGCGRS